MSVTESIFDAARNTETLIRSWLGGDEKINATPVHDETKNIDADEWNNLVAGVSEVAFRLRKGNIHVVKFYIANATAGLTNQELQIFGPDASRLTERQLFDASVVGIVAECENAITANDATVVPYLNGVASSNLEVVLDSSNQYARDYQLPNLEGVDALETIGCKLTTHASFAAGTTPSIWVDVYLSLGEEEEL